jgi:membrane protein required for colicin V production
MTWIDYAALGVTAISVLWGAWRGLVRETISLGAWVIAFLAANLLAGPAGDALPESLGRPELRVLLAFVGIFIITLAVCSIAGLLLSRLLKAAGLAGLDRMLGALFGVARALLILVALGLLAGLTRLPADPAWGASVTGPILERAAIATKPWLPPAFTSRLRYH